MHTPPRPCSPPIASHACTSAVNDEPILSVGHSDPQTPSDGHARFILSSSNRHYKIIVSAASYQSSSLSYAALTMMRTDSRSLFRTLRDDLWAALVEFIGTIVFLTLGLGGIQAAATSNRMNQIASTNGGPEAINTVASVEQLLYISASMGLSLLISVWLFYRASGGVFNPAISTALLLIGAIGPVRFILYCLAQLLGGIIASALLLALLPGPLAVNTTPGPGINKAQAVWIEAFLTFCLVMTVLMLAAEKHKTTAFAPIGIGLTLFACHLWGVLYTGAGMNTARAFGPAVVTSFSSSHWVYWLGPFIGSLMATALYWMLKAIKYWKLAEDQDTEEHHKSPDPGSPSAIISRVLPTRSKDEHPQGSTDRDDDRMGEENPV